MANDFVQNPGGSSKGTKPRDFVNVQRTQPNGAPEPGEGSVGGTALDDNTPSQGQNSRGNPIGTGSVSGGGKPYKLGGG